MVKLSKRPDVVTVGKLRARPVCANSLDGIEVKEWIVTNPDGSSVASVPADVFAADGLRMLECYDQGIPYVPTVELAGQSLPPQMAWQKRLELLTEGRDQTLLVPAFTRALAGLEATEDGMFRGALQRHSVEQWPGLQRELFASLYEEPAELTTVEGADGWVKAIHEQAAGLEQWEDLKRQCQGDPWAAGIGAGRVTSMLGNVLDEAIRKLAPAQDPVRQAAEAEELEELAPGAGAVQAEQAEQGQLLAEALRNELGTQKTELKIRHAIRQAAEQAEGEIEEVRAAMTGLGVGSGSGTLGAVQAPQDAVRKALQADPKLRRVAEIAGRMRMRARDKQRRKVDYLPEQVVDVTLGGELSRLLPSELTLLASEETELLAIKKLVEHQALEFRLEGREPLDQGPVILCVDSSGSMAGARNEWAMGVALAVLEVCAMQRRAFCLVHFDGTVQKTFEVPASGRLGLPKLIEMVSFFSGGGTAFAPPLEWSSSRISQRDGVWSKADVILVTDGGGSWGNAVAELKSQNASVYGVAIETDFSAAQAAELAGVARIANLAESGRAQTGKAQDGPVDLVFGI